MSIPKVIHYCWFGKKPKDKSVLKCMRSWKKYCPDYEIIEWNETNFDINVIPYTAQAYACGKWAFVTDYVRLRVIYEYGGIYLDTDVELKKTLDSLLSNNAFLGFEKMGDVYQINTGIGFGAVCGHPLIKKLMESYHSLSFYISDGKMDLTPCSERNTRLLVEEGMKTFNEPQMVGDVRILPTEYLCPADYMTGKISLTGNTLAIHHYQATWKDVKPGFGNKVKGMAKKIFGHHRYKLWAMKKKKLYSIFK